MTDQHVWQSHVKCRTIVISIITITILLISHLHSFKNALHLARHCVVNPSVVCLYI